jgi:ADP-ribose pyrophosphatase YjhB (NUDIX family)
MGMHGGPSLLVLIIMFAGDRMLLMKRGTEPYRGKWAPPGGFVESGESVEAACVREVWEETRIRLTKSQLVPRAIISLPAMNQVYQVFFARVAEAPSGVAVPPESLDVRWVSESELVELDLWAPALEIDFRDLFEKVGSNSEGFAQWNEEFLRIIGATGQIEYYRRHSAFPPDVPQPIQLGPEKTA